MDIREEIINKYLEFSHYLESVNLNELRKKFTRKELNELKGILNNIEIRSLPYEIGEITEEMKKEEYPELLGIHHYPILKEIDFLTEREKLELDKFLVKFTPNRDYIQTFWKVVKNPKKTDLLVEFLINQGIVEERHVILCPSCHESHMSIMMTNDEKETLKNLIQSKTDYEELEQYLEMVCDECFSELEPSQIEDRCVKTYLLLVKERDKTLDHV